MLSEKLKQLAATFADAVSEVVETEMRDRMTNALSALGATGGSGDTEVRRGRPAKTPKTPKTGKKAKSEGRLARRSLEEIQAVVADVVKLVAKHPDGLRSETIRTELDLDVREVPRVLKEGVAMGALKSHGQKRATVYFAGKGGKTPKAKKASSKKTPKAKAASKKAPKKAAKKNKAKAASKKTKAKVSKSANGVTGHAAPAAQATA